MPIHVDELHSEVGVSGELPLSAAQLDRIVEAVAARMVVGSDTGAGDTGAGDAAAIRPGAAPPGPVEV
jgi:hypothetical protein